MSRPHNEDLRREQTIRAVWASVASHGIEGTTIERVAELGGFSKGVVHYYFESKKALLLAAFQAYLEAYDGEIIERLGALGREPGAKEVLDAVIDSTLPPFSPEDLEEAELAPLALGEALTPHYKARLFLQFISLAVRERDFAAVVSASYERQGAAIAECFAALGPEGARDASASFVALIDGFSLHRVLGYVPSGLPDHAELARGYAQLVSTRSD
jgi:AcrR family transcriptional regulator